MSRRALWFVLALACTTLTIAPPVAAQPAPLASNPEEQSRDNVPADIAQLLNAHDYGRAVPRLRDAVAAAPTNARLAVLLALALWQTDQFDQAEVAATTALRFELTPTIHARVVAMRGHCRVRLGWLRDAESDAEEALRLNPNEPMALEVGAMAAAASRNFPLALQRARRLVEIQPNAGGAHSVLAQVLATAERFDEARTEAATARRLGANEAVLDSIESTARGRQLATVAWQAPLIAAGVLALGLLVMLLAGLALSKAQLAQLASVSPHLLRDEQTLGERLVDRMYSATLWFASLLFFASIPLLVIITAAAGLGSVYAMAVYGHRIDSRLAVLGLIVGIGGPWAILRGVFLARLPPAEGTVLDPTAEPKLFEAVREVAGVTRSRMVDRIVLETGISIGVREEGGAFEVLFGRGKRVLMIGLGALSGLTVSEFKAILAHEYGHFAHGETRLGPMIGRVVETAVTMVVRIASLGFGRLNPAYWFLRAYLPLYIGITRGRGRRRELLADRMAALSYGGDTFGSALSRMIDRSDFFAREAGNLATTLRMAGRRAADIYGTVDIARNAVPDEDHATRLKTLLSREQHPNDTHPPPDDRIRRVAGIAASRPAESDSAMSLFANADALARACTDQIMGRIERALELKVPYRPRAEPIEPRAEAAMIETVMNYFVAIDAATNNAPNAIERLRASVERLSATVGGEDRLMIGALSDLAAIEQQRGNVRESVPLLERAVSISRARDPGDSKRIAALEERLRETTRRVSALPTAA